MQEAKGISKPVRILKDPEVKHFTGLSRRTRDDLSKAGEFPPPVWISKRSRGYLSDEIEAWIESRRDNRTTHQEKPWCANATGS